MTDIVANGTPALRAPHPGVLERLTRGRVLARLASLRRGELRIQEAGEEFVFGTRAADGLAAAVTVHDPRFYSSVALRGSVGAGESFMDGHWTTSDLASVMRVMVRNRPALEEIDGGLARFAMPFLRLFHRLRRNDRDGSRKNIAAHYDLGNDFFELFLDETLTYSCGIFETPASTLAEASIEKIDRICRRLDLQRDERVIEIGTGWGSFALHAAATYGCHVTTTTISQRQHDVATQRVRDAGLSDRIEIVRRDYRDLTGTYDKLVSIEMIEAVGHGFLDTYFAKCASLLAPHGAMALQAITIADQFHDEALRTVDFIKRYVFPGCYIPSVGSITGSVGRASDMVPVHLEDIGLHYARTLREWRERFMERADDVRALGFPERFVRLWEFYLAYCEGGFAERQIGDVQMVFAKPDWRS